MSEKRPSTAFVSANSTVTDNATAKSGSAASTATLTYRFLPGGADCERCGVRTKKQWVDDGEFVCADCKPWTVQTG